MMLNWLIKEMDQDELIKYGEAFNNARELGIELICGMEDQIKLMTKLIEMQNNNSSLRSNFSCKMQAVREFEEKIKNKYTCDKIKFEQDGPTITIKKVDSNEADE